MTFGTCTGVFNASGCYGDYAVRVDFDGYPDFLVSVQNTEYQFFDFPNPLNVVLENTETPYQRTVSFSCSSGFDPHTGDCPKGSFNSFIENPNQPGNNTVLQVNCGAGTLLFLPLRCSDGTAATIRKCVGVSFANSSYDLNCYGDFVQRTCVNGINQDATCTDPTESGIGTICLGSFYDGVECKSSHVHTGPALVPTLRTNQTFSNTTAKNGQNYNYVLFNLNSPSGIRRFTLRNGVISNLTTGTSIIRDLNISSAVNQTTSLTSVRFFNRTQAFFDRMIPSTTFVSVTKADLDDMDLKGLVELYNGTLPIPNCQTIVLNYTALNAADVGYFNIRQTSTIRQLNIGSATTTNAGLSNLVFVGSEATVFFSTTRIGFKYFTSTDLQAWIDQNNENLEIDLNGCDAATITNTVFPQTKLKFRREANGQLRPFLRFENFSFKAGVTSTQVVARNLILNSSTVALATGSVPPGYIETAEVGPTTIPYV